MADERKQKLTVRFEKFGSINLFIAFWQFQANKEIDRRALDLNTISWLQNEQVIFTMFKNLQAASQLKFHCSFFNYLLGCHQVLSFPIAATPT